MAFSAASCASNSRMRASSAAAHGGLPQRGGCRREVVEPGFGEALLQVVRRRGRRFREARRGPEHLRQLGGQTDPPLGGTDPLADTGEITPSRVDGPPGVLERPPCRGQLGQRGRPLRRDALAKFLNGRGLGDERLAVGAQRFGADRGFGCRGSRAARIGRAGRRARLHSARRRGPPHPRSPARPRAGACVAAASAARAAPFAASASAIASGVTGSPPRGAGDGCSSEPHTAHDSPAHEGLGELARVAGESPLPKLVEGRGCRAERGPASMAARSATRGRLQERGRLPRGAAAPLQFAHPIRGGLRPGTGTCRVCERLVERCDARRQLEPARLHLGEPCVEHRECGLESGHVGFRSAGCRAQPAGPPTTRRRPGSTRRRARRAPSARHLLHPRQATPLAPMPPEPSPQ